MPNSDQETETATDVKIDDKQEDSTVSKVEIDKAELSNEEKLEKIKAEDAKIKENEIKFGIRTKLITLFAVIILIVAIGVTYIATENQSSSLLEEKQKQGTIIVRALSASIKTKLLDIYADNADLLQRLQGEDNFKNFYRNNDISNEIFEYVDQVKSQPDVVYAYILGKHRLVLGHTNTKIEPYTSYNFEKGIESYFDLYEKLNLKEPKPILRKINVIEEKEGKPITNEIVDFSSIIAFQNNPTIKDAIAEVHIGISLASVNQQIFENKVQLQLAGIAAIIFGIVIAIIFATLIARPLLKVIEGMQAVSEGDFSASVILKSKDEVGLLSKTFNVMLKGMSILVSPEVAQVVLSGQDLTKSGEKKLVTVLFSDIRSFTTISEALTPHEVVEMLNNYMEIMTNIIIKYGGVVDKFVGDEIFAVYGAPFEHPMHPLCAAATALEMGVELAEHNDERLMQGKPKINIGIGVNTGDVIAGAMGSSKRIDYTSIGDAVNLGARLEGTNKVYGTLAIISEFTYEYIKEDVIVRELDLIKVKGKHLPVKIFEVIALSEKGEAKIQAFLEEKAEKEKNRRNKV